MKCKVHLNSHISVPLYPNQHRPVRRFSEYEFVKAPSFVIRPNGTFTDSGKRYKA